MELAIKQKMSMQRTGSFLNSVFLLAFVTTASISPLPYRHLPHAPLLKMMILLSLTLLTVNFHLGVNENRLSCQEIPIHEFISCCTSSDLQQTKCDPYRGLTNFVPRKMYLQKTAYGELRFLNFSETIQNPRLGFVL